MSETMGDSNVENSNRVEGGGVQGANIVNSEVHNPIFNIHTPGRNYQRIKVIGRGTFGDAWLVKPKNVAGSEDIEFVMKEIRCCDQDVDAGHNEIEILKQLSHENIVQYKACIELPQNCSWKYVLPIKYISP